MNESNEGAQEEGWDLVIDPISSSRVFNWKELLRYKDLMFLFVKRDFIALYKQTVLGPLWVVIQPILTTITLWVVFTKIATIDTGGIPPILFYMLGVTVWTYFADCVTKTSDTFIVNQGIFGKVYFPRLIVPMSIVITNLIKLAIQFSLFIVVYIITYFLIGFSPDVDGEIAGVSWQLALIPFLIVILAALGLGVGLIISGLTTKYRDLRFLITFGIQLMMYATPIVWPLKNIKDPTNQMLAALNPIAGIVETFKVAFFGVKNGVFNWYYLGYSILFSFIVLYFGMRLFSRVEKSFIDTV